MAPCDAQERIRELEAEVARLKAVMLDVVEAMQCDISALQIEKILLAAVCKESGND